LSFEENNKITIKVWVFEKNKIRKLCGFSYLKIENGRYGLGGRDFKLF
jgi:hypothetical protein